MKLNKQLYCIIFIFGKKLEVIITSEILISLMAKRLEKKAQVEGKNKSTSEMAVMEQKRIGVGEKVNDS